MQTTKNRPSFLTGKLWCAFFGHQFITTRNVTGHFKEYQCSKCRMELTNDEKGRKISLTPELRDINETLVLFYQKRHPLI